MPRGAVDLAATAMASSVLSTGVVSVNGDAAAALGLSAGRRSDVETLMMPPAASVTTTDSEPNTRKPLYVCWARVIFWPVTPGCWLLMWKL